MTAPDQAPLTGDEQRTLRARTDAYHYGFDRTGVQSVDDLLHAFAWAGAAMHDTADWTETIERGYGPIRDGESVTEMIQRVAIAAATAVQAAVARAGADALQDAADDHEAQLVCCDVYDRLKDKPPAQWTDTERREHRTHAICYWGAACAEGDRDRAANLTADR